MRALAFIVVALWGGLFFSSIGHASTPSDCFHVKNIVVDHIEGVSDDYCFLKCLMKRHGASPALSGQSRESHNTVYYRFSSSFYLSSGAYISRQSSQKASYLSPTVFNSDYKILYALTRRLRI